MLLFPNFNDEIPIEVSQETPLYPGEIVEFHYKVIGGTNWEYFRAVQLSVIHWAMADKFPNLKILNEESTENGFIIRCEIQVMQPSEQVQYAGGILTAAIIAAAVIGGGLFVTMALEKVYKITSSPAGQVALVGAGLGGVGLFLIIAIVGLSLLKGR